MRRCYRLFPYNPRFPGQYYDAETGLNQNLNRDYDPIVARYVESDPIGLGGRSYSTYSYVNNNPLWFADPIGLLAPSPGFWPIVGTATAEGASEGAELGAEGGTVVEPGGGTAVGAVAGAVVGGVVGLAVGIYEACKEPCPPCRTVSGRIVPVGTIAYRPMETPPPGETDHGIAGPHYNLYKANQAPRNSPQPCKCFWQPIKAVPAAALPPNAMPIEPFAP